VSKGSYIRIVVAAAATVLFAAWFFFRQNPGESENGTPAPKVRIGIQENSITAIVIVAYGKGLFEQQDLDVIIHKYPSGKLALQAMLKGEVDFATVADMPIMSNSFTRDDYLVLSTIASTDSGAWIIARRDHGIAEASDLKGKKIATQKASAVHFFLSMFLLHNRIPESEVDIVYMKAVDLPSALLAGKIDAFSMRNPFIAEASAALGQNGVELYEPGVYKQTFNLCARKAFLNANPGLVGKVLKALASAESFISQNRDAAMEVVVGELGLSRSAEVARDWDNFVFALSLDQSLLLTLEDQARWAIRHGLTNKTEIPNYMEFLYIDGLATVKPEAVTVIR
jgi:NitT/TauT family transport system substrate-binding protein